jgi:hypothetical protein
MNWPSGVFAAMSMLSKDARRNGSTTMVKAASTASVA